MSLALEKIDVLGVNVPVLDIDKKPEYAVIHGGNYVQYKQYQSTSYSPNSFQFSAPPPSEKILVGRKVLLRTPVTIQINGTAGSSGLMWNVNYDAIRAYALSSNLQTIQATINNSTATVQMSDVIQPLLRYHNPECMREVEYSLTPTQLDNAQNYEDLAPLSVRNVLGSYENADGVTHRGAFPYVISSNTSTQAVITCTLAEYIYLSPFYFGFGDAKGFYGVRTMDFNFTWNTNLSRFISHANSSVSATISSVSVTFGQPSLLFQYVTPPMTMPRPALISYPYYVVNRFPTGPTAIASNTTTVVSSNNIQLNSIPRRMYIFARQQNGEQTFNSTDTYAEIQNISIQFENVSGLLASASEQDLYNISKQNGLNMSWTDWTGGPVQGSSGIYGTCGSVLCICPGIDIGLPDNLSSGVVGQFMMQYNITLRNPNVGTNAKSINYMLYLITVDEGVWSITNGTSIPQGQGVVSQMDVLNAKSKPWISYDDVAFAQGAGRFFSNMKNHMRRRMHHLMHEKHDKGEGVNVGGVNVGGNGGVLLGGGSLPENEDKKEEKAGVVIGGKTISPKELKAKLKKYV